MDVAELLYLSREDVEATGVEMAEVIEVVDAVFREKGEGRVEMPPKPGIHPRPEAFIHAMPAYVPSVEAAGMKWVGGNPDNPERGVPYISGLVVLNDPETELPLSVMDCTWITAMRTGAATAVAARYLARSDSSTLGILGCGVQGRSNLLALAEVFSLERVLAYDVDWETARKYAEEMEARLEIAVEPVDGPRYAVVGCDLVITAGPILKEPHATIRSGWLEPGATACPVDFDSYWSREALTETDKFCTDDTDQLRHYQEIGYFQEIPPIHADLGELATGQRPGREREDERIVCCNLGLAIEDMVTADLVYRRAQERNLGTRLPR